MEQEDFEEEADDIELSPYLDDEQQPDWKRPLDLQRIELDWESDGSNWMQRIPGHLGSPSRLMSHRGGTKRRPGIILVSPEEETCLWVHFNGTQLKAQVWGFGSVDRVSIRRWQQAALGAYERLCTDPHLPWVASIRTRPWGSAALYSRLLVAPGKLGALTLEPGSDPYIEVVKTGVNAHVSHSYPVIVRGKCSAANGSEIGSSAKGELRRLCLVLSIAWDGCWVLLQPPRPDTGERFQQMTCSPWDKELGHRQESDGVREDVRIEPWLERVVEGMAADNALMRAASIYHEGLLLSEDHPSLAAVCFTAVIEIIGESAGGGLPQCQTCSQVTGSTSRFRSTLAEALSSPEAKSLSDLYEKRSRTVHSGALHGAEVVLGDPFGDFHIADSRMRFDFERYKLQQACRTLLRKRLGVPASDQQ